MDLSIPETMLLGYLAITTAVGLVRIGEQPAIAWVVLANALASGVLITLSRLQLSPGGRILRTVTPVLLLMAVFPALDILNRFGAVTVHDPTVRGWERALFGGDLSRIWWQAMPSRFWSTVFHGAYFAYYPLVLAPVTYFLLRGETEEAERSVRWMLSAFLLSYLAFLAFPVAGPYYEFSRPAAWFLDNPMARLVYGALAQGSAYGAAFPSSHVAGTLVAVAAAMRGSRPLGYVMILPAGLLTVGVVYCQMHYAVDALAGVLLAAAVVAGWRWWEGSCRVRVSRDAARGTRNGQPAY